MTTYLVTGASGQLGQLVVDHLSTLVPAGDIIALVRSDDAAKANADKGIATRKGDYEDVDSLKAAFDGIDRLLLISSSEVGKRATQHGNVLNAAKAALSASALPVEQKTLLAQTKGVLYPHVSGCSTCFACAASA